jgi:hypothetical protein
MGRMGEGRNGVIGVPGGGLYGSDDALERARQVIAVPLNDELEQP